MRRQHGTRPHYPHAASKDSAATCSIYLLSREQRRPGRIRCVTRRRHLLLVAAGEIDGIERGPGVAAGIAEEHQHAPVRREGRALVVEARRENALARAVRLDHADRELAARLLVAAGEIDGIERGP